MTVEIIEKCNQNDDRTEGEQYLLDIFRTSPRFNGWTIFEQPHINSMKPDFVLVNPKKGIIIIEVKDWNLALNTYESGGYIKGTDGNLHKKCPLSQVEHYKKSILKSELNNYIDLAEKGDKYFGAIETVVYFHKASRKEAREFCSNSYEHKYTKIWTRDDIDYISDIDNNLTTSNHTYALTREFSSLNEDGGVERLVNELIVNLNASDYDAERKRPIILTREQQELAKLSSGKVRRWSGVAGAGKSLVLSEKAVRALKDNSRVLLLTYNITLRHYLKDLCSQQFGANTVDNDRRILKDNLTITHYHEFLMTFMNEHGIQFNSSNNNNDEFTEEWIKKIYDYLKLNSVKKRFNYDYILIDEGQDFKGDWIRLLKEFYNEDGELFIVYDKAQDIFEHGLWIEDSEQIKNIGFKGRPGNLKYSYRLPLEVSNVLNDIRNVLKIEGDEILIPKENRQVSFLGKLDWDNCTSTDISSKLDSIDKYVNKIRESNKAEDVTIITTNENTGVEIVNYFNAKDIRTSHVYDMSKQKNIKLRRNEKWKFRGGTDRLKVCSFQSFKGWQTPNIILVLDPPTTDYIGGLAIEKGYDKNIIEDAIFISLSRVKSKIDTGEFSFTCLNYISEYNKMIECFLPF